MGLALSAQHLALAQAVEKFSVDHDVRAAARALLDNPPTAVSQPDVLWKTMATRGWTGLHISEEYGGSGLGLPELAIVLEGLGREIAPGPLSPTVAAAALVAECGNSDLRGDLLPGLIDGSTPGSVAIVSGAARGAIWASVHLSVIGHDVVVHRGTAIDPVDAMDPALGAGSVVTEENGEVIVGGASALVRHTRIATAAEAVGGARAALDSALHRAKVRQPSGRATGGLGSVEHRLTDMLIRCELATAAVWGAARAPAGPESDLAAAVASVVAVDAYLSNARMNIRIDSGTGFTWDDDAHLHLRRATSLAAFTKAPHRAADDVTDLIARGVRRIPDTDLPAREAQHGDALRELGCTATSLLVLANHYARKDFALHREVGTLAAVETSLALLELRAAEAGIRDAETPIEEIVRLVRTENEQRFTDLAMQIAGVAGVTGGEPGVALAYLQSHQPVGAGRTTEMARESITESMLGRLSDSRLARSAGGSSIDGQEDCES